MIVKQLEKGQTVKKSVGCGICNSQIKRHDTIKKIGTILSIICMDCAEEFEDNEIELMENMFTTFGGYYGNPRLKAILLKE